MADTLDEPRVHYIRTMAAAELFFYLRQTDDSLTATVDGAKMFWSLTRAGTPVDRRIVNALVLDGSLVPFGAQLLDDAPSCLIVNPAIGAVHLGSPPKAGADDGEEEAETADASLPKEEAEHMGPSPTACGAFCRDACEIKGWCLDCAPPEIVRKRRKGKCENWHGPAPDPKGGVSK